MNYAKLINNELQMAPKKIQSENTVVYNPPVEMLEAHGYKPVIYTEAPEPPEGYYVVSGWEELEDGIYQVWYFEEKSDEVDAEEALEILLGGTV